MANDTAIDPPENRKLEQFGNLTSDERSAFKSFKELCAAGGLTIANTSDGGDDLTIGICDDGTLL